MTLLDGTIQMNVLRNALFHCMDILLDMYVLMFVLTLTIKILLIIDATNVQLSV